MSEKNKETIQALKTENSKLKQEITLLQDELKYVKNHAGLEDKPVDKRAFVICNELKKITGIPALSVDKKLEYLDNIKDTIEILRTKLRVK